MLTHTLGFPRIGQDRELKKALEACWKDAITADQLQAVAQQLRLRHWQWQKDQGIDLIPVGDFSFYDHVLDTSAMLGAVPSRFGFKGGQVDLATYFRMARGQGQTPAMEMSKWFDTNYHYLVPEFEPGQAFRLSSTQLFDHVREALAAGVNAKPVLVGPLTYLKLGKPVVEGFDPLDLLDALLPVYEEVIARLAGQVKWIQIDEPVLVLDLSDREKQAFTRAWARLAKSAGDAKIILATYFGDMAENLPLACDSGAAAVHVDLTRGPGQLAGILPRLKPGQSLSLGVVDGRNVWRVDADAAGKLIQQAVDTLGRDRVMVASSCSLLHSPMDLAGERKSLDAEVKSWLSFARQKCGEIRLLADVALGQADVAALEANRAAWRSRRSSSRVTNPQVRGRVAKVTADMARRVTPHARRKAIQQAILNLPALPTTTIGSFPQTAQVRQVRSQFKAGQIDQAAYDDAIKGFIRESVDRQHELGLDVLVHGEAERNDMVEYFGQQLDGFAFTDNGWVQSYGSRCVKPPIIYGDVSRPRPMTVAWAKYAQSLTDKPMKGMLTGPVTILCWSFVRDDQPRSQTCRQIALAIRDEVNDLEAAGIAIIQVDEAALREGLPLRRGQWDEYLSWAVESFRLSTSGIADRTQLHTHMCYSEFNDIIEWIARMDADVISIEASRSRMELLKAFAKFDYPNDIGPGVYDIHSPRVPSADEMAGLLKDAMAVIPVDRLWVNPDCGLKTRGWPETIESLEHMVQVAHEARQAIAR